MPAVKPVPDNMHTITPHLICAGAAEAIEFYKKAFNAVEEVRLPGPAGAADARDDPHRRFGRDAGRRNARMGRTRTEIAEGVSSDHPHLRT